MIDNLNKTERDLFISEVEKIVIPEHKVMFALSMPKNHRRS